MPQRSIRGRLHTVLIVLLGALTVLSLGWQLWFRSPRLVDWEFERVGQRNLYVAGLFHEAHAKLVIVQFTETVETALLADPLGYPRGFGFTYEPPDIERGRYYSITEVSFPLWLVTQALAAYPAFLGARSLLARRRSHRVCADQCLECGYDLRGSGEVCPERGTRRDRSSNGTSPERDD